MDYDVTPLPDFVRLSLLWQPVWLLILFQVEDAFSRADKYLCSLAVTPHHNEKINRFFSIIMLRRPNFYVFVFKNGVSCCVHALCKHLYETKIV